MISFKYLFNTDVSQIVEELSQAEELWDEHTYRTEGYISPHRHTSDIFVRFNPVDNYKDDFSLFNVPIYQRGMKVLNYFRALRN